MFLVVPQIKDDPNTMDIPLIMRDYKTQETEERINNREINLFKFSRRVERRIIHQENGRA